MARGSKKQEEQIPVETNGHSKVNEAAFDAAVEAVTDIEEAPKRQAVDHVKFANGVVIGIKLVNRNVVTKAADRVVRPTIPKFFNPDQDREEENPNHPDYVDAMMKYRNDRQEAIYNASFILGTYPKYIPEGIPGPEDDGWAEELLFVGAIDPETMDNKYARYLAWLTMYVMVGDDDPLNLLIAITSQLGIQEADVQDAVAGFPDNSEGDADPGSET